MDGGSLRHRAAIGLMAFVAVALLTACVQTRPKPQVIIRPSGEIATYKRFERYPRRDFTHRFVRSAYSTPRGEFDLAGADQQTILEQWGSPEYVRKRFTSLQDERIEEWLYMDLQRLFQFVDHNIVYEGPITDLEQLLLLHGYPDKMTTHIGESGIVRHMLYYRPIFNPGRFETYNLADGKIIHRSEGD